MSARGPNDFKTLRTSQIGEEAGIWLQRLADEYDPEDPIPDPRQRQAAFFAWLEQSPEHLRSFYELMQLERLMARADRHRSIEVNELLAARLANVIHLHGATEPGLEQQAPTAARPQVAKRRRTVAYGLAAGMAMLICSALAWLLVLNRHAYNTGIGEQRSVKLEDGSFVLLNTDSRVEIEFTGHERRVVLARGEALFNVVHHSSRPFIVSSGGVDIRAVGTQFNVRRRDEATDVAVVEGVVQIATAQNRSIATGTQAGLAASAPTQLGAGETAHIVSGHINREQRPNLDNALSWRKRRLVFTDVPLAEVAAEFNRYNRTKIRVEGAAAKTKQLSGIFDADRPTAVIGYAMKDDSLSVEPEGSNWVIRDHSANEP